MGSNKWVSVAFGAVLGATAMASAYADAGKELLLSGPVEQIDRGGDTVTVLGQKFKAPADQLSLGQVVNVYGQLTSDGSITDPVVQGTNRFGTNGDPVFLKGVVTNSDAALGRVGVDGLTIDYTAELANADFTMPSVGDVIAVSGTEPAAKGLLMAAAAGLAAYGPGATGNALAAPAGVATSGAEAAGMTGSRDMTGSRTEIAGMTGSRAGVRAAEAGMTGSR